jgi:hypothetical protein
MRAPSLLLVGLVLHGCGGIKHCKEGTLLVQVDLVGGDEEADKLSVDVSIAGGQPMRTELDHPPGASSGTIEVEFPSGYPYGQAVTVTVTASRSGTAIGRSLAVAILRAGCDVTTVSIGDPTHDGGVTIPDAQEECPGGGIYNQVTGCPVPVPSDPEFKGTSTWMLGGGAVIDPTAPGLDDVGELILDRAAICMTGGSARQSITMPTFEASVPFALTHTVMRECTTSAQGCMGGDVAVRFRDGAITIPTAGYLVKSRTCLGARAYGGTFDLIVSAGDKNDCADPMLSALDLRIDRLSILPEPDCPAPSEIKDADFDGDRSGWQLQLNNGTATIDPCVGVGGSQAGHITTSLLCQSPKLRGIQSVPLGPQVALELSVKGTMGKVALIGEETNLARWASVTGTGIFEIPRVCVPEYAKGMVLPLLLSTETSQGACSTLDVRDFVFDNLSFVTEPSCPMTAEVIDPGFERYSILPQWNLEVNTDGSPGQATATVVSDATLAHAGSSALRLGARQFCTAARANTVISVPQPKEGAGPMIKFFYQAPTLNNTVAYGATQTTQVKLQASTNWQTAMLCLDPARAGQGQYFEIVLSSSGICGLTFSEESAFFDDFEVTTDPSCPTE